MTCKEPAKSDKPQEEPTKVDECNQAEEPVVKSTEADKSEPIRAQPEPATAPEGQSTAHDDGFIKFVGRTAEGTEKAYKATKSALNSAKFDPLLISKKLDACLSWAREKFGVGIYESIAKWFVRYGHAGLLTACALLVLIAVIGIFRGWPGAFFKPLGLAAVILILQYTANKFLNAGKSLIDSSPSRLGSRAFLDCLCFLGEIVGIVLFIWCLIRGRGLALQAGSFFIWAYLWIGLALWTLCDSIAFVALHPKMVNISISEDVRGSEEAIGIMSFFVKAIMRVVPLAFGAASIFGAIALLCSAFAYAINGIGGVQESALIVAFGAALPLFSYVVFAFYHLVIDLLRSILVLPGKIDELKKN